MTDGFTLKLSREKEEDGSKGESSSGRSPMTSNGKNAVRRFSEKYESDVLLINRPIERGLEIDVISAVRFRKERRKNLLLVLVTSGGNADVAFRIARCLQDSYEKMSIFVSGWCKSAGTLIALGAHTVYFGEFGELGPLDVQVGKKDELWEYSSGLDLEYALQSLRATSFDMFENYLLSIMNKSSGRITFKTASEVAALLTSSYTREIAAQIEPLNIGETSRLMVVAADYGRRLDLCYENLLSEDALSKLVSGYSSHSFVIDLREANALFKRAEAAPPEMVSLQIAMGVRETILPIEGKAGSDGIVEFVTDCLNDDDEQNAEARGTTDGPDDKISEPAAEGTANPEAKHDVGSDENAGRADGTSDAEAHSKE